MNIESKEIGACNPEVRGYIFEIQKLSTEDGPGIRTTVFLKECPLRCKWCHNPESIFREASIQWFKNKCIGCMTCADVCPRHAISSTPEGIKIDREKCDVCGCCVENCPSTAMKMLGEWHTIDEIFTEIRKDRVYYDTSGGGVTFSGGEPTMQMPFLEAIMKKCQQEGISIALDTCGLTSYHTYSKLIPFVDVFLLDIKEINSEKHRKFVGHPNEKILETIEWLAGQLSGTQKQLWIRTPLIPEYTATRENITGIAEFIVNRLDNKIERWDLLAFNNLCKAKYDRMNLEWELADIPLMTKTQMEHYYELAISMGVERVSWSGLTRKSPE